MYGIMMLDNYMADMSLSMRIHHSVPGSFKPGEISDCVKLPSPATLTICNFLSMEYEDNVDLDLTFMQKVSKL